MTIQLWELTGADEARQFSPYCWRIRMALRHKGLACETIPWRFVEKDRIAASGGGTVPVIEHGGKMIRDSWAIAEYLEETFPDRPSLFWGSAGKALARFATDWVETAIQPAITPIILTDIFAHLHEKDRAYFRESREKRFGGTSLEEVSAGREAKLPAFQRSLSPLRHMLGRQKFMTGEGPAWADFTLFGIFQWARCISPFPLLEPSDPVHEWRERMLDSYGGYGRAALGYPV